MSFSNEIKNEILANKLFYTRYRKACAYGLFLFCRRFGAEGIGLSTENSEVAGLFGRFARGILGREAGSRIEEKRTRGGTVYSCAIKAKEDCAYLLSYFGGGTPSETISGKDEAAAFLAGAFLSCGRMTDPEKSYRLEFVTRSKELCAGLAETLDARIPGVKITTRRGLYVAYYKECRQIEDLLTLMGASKSSLAMIEIEMIKDVRNRVNRVTNCETANIDKTVGAAAGQIADIRLIFDRIGAASLPEGLRKAAEIRLENPELSLRELAASMDEPISRSGMHHRFEKLARIAEELRAGGGYCGV